MARKRKNLSLFATFFILLAKLPSFLFANSFRGCIMTTVEPEDRADRFFSRRKSARKKAI